MSVEGGNHAPRFWSFMRETSSLVSRRLELPNPGRVMILLGVPFHLGDDGRTLKAFTDKELKQFRMEHRI